MKYSTLDSFEKHLVGAAPDHFGELYLIISKEPFIRKQMIDRIAELVLKSETSLEFCFRLYDAEKHGINSIIEEFETLSFFIKRRVIVIQNIDAFDKSATAKLEDYFSHPNRAICLVLATSSINRNTNFYKKAEKAGIILDVVEEKPWEREKTIGEWLRREALLCGKELPPQTSEKLIKQLGLDLAILHNEVQKLVCYVGEKSTISEKDVDAVCTHIHVDNAWQLGEAIFRRDAATALRIAKGLLEDGTAAIALLRQIRSQFQVEYHVCSILVQEGTSADITKEFPYMKGPILDRHIKQAKGYGMARFKAALLAIDDAESKAKNSNLDPEFLVELLLIKLVT